MAHNQSLDDCSEEEVETPLELYPNEYVIARINIEKSLAAEFYAHAMYNNTPGTFPLDSKEAVLRAWNLINEFLSEYRLPDPNDSPKEWKCPRFIPQDRLVYVRDVYGSDETCYRGELFPVLVAPSGTLIRDCSGAHTVDKPAYAAIHPTPTPEPTYPPLFTERVFLPNYSLYQNVYEIHPCLISSVTEESDPFCLRMDSQSLFEELNSLASVSIGRFYNENGNGAKKTVAVCSNFRCDLHTPPTLSSRFSIATLDDIAFDLDRRSSAILGYKPAIDSPESLSLDMEANRMMMIIDDWVDWFTTR